MRNSRWPASFILATALLAGGAALTPTPVEAQERRPTARPAGRAVARPPVRHARPARAVIPARRVFAGGRLYRPYGPYAGFYDPFYGPYASPYGYGHYVAPYYGGYGYSSAVRLEVEPEETEVYVDGYYTGVVDSYDGFLQRLRLPPGEHEIELYLEGHESIRQTLHLAPGETYRIRHDMQPLADGAPRPTRPEPVASPIDPGPSAPSAPFLPPATVDRFGMLVVRVRPLDATVTVDGEQWVGHEGLGELVLDLGAGIHSLEVSRADHRTYRTDVEIAPGGQTVVNVSLPRTEEQ
jgi:hypothetical protein